MINSGESFGISGGGVGGLRSSGLVGNPSRFGGAAAMVGSSQAYLRETIKDDFLNENDEDEIPSIRESAESGEMIFNPVLGRAGNNNHKK
jgi:hypothetical protein